MKKLTYLLLGMGLVFSLTSCPGGEDACPDKWQVNRTSNDLIVEIDSVANNMSLQISNIFPVEGSGIMGEVLQSYFDGNYNIKAPFSNFICPTSPSTGRSYVEMVMYNGAVPDTVLDTNVIVAGISRDFIYVKIGTQMAKAPRPATTNSGTFRIQKLSSSVTVQMLCTDTVTLSKNFSFTPLYVGFRVGSLGDSTVLGQTAIKINQFNVSGTTGTTVYSDEFKCNSIYVP